jgi:hypothetical protein
MSVFLRHVKQGTTINADNSVNNVVAKINSIMDNVVDLFEPNYKVALAA